MERFRADGHLTEEALAVLIQTGEMDPLGRLEMAEHLSFCDVCLQRYTDMLSSVELLTPPQSCEKGLWVRIRLRAIRLVTSRYATAAAAVALALTVLWGGGEVSFTHPVRTEEQSAAVEYLHTWPERWNDALNRTLSGVTGFFDGLRPGNNT